MASTHARALSIRSSNGLGPLEPNSRATNAEGMSVRERPRLGRRKGTSRGHRAAQKQREVHAIALDLHAHAPPPPVSRRARVAADGERSAREVAAEADVEGHVRVVRVHVQPQVLTRLVLHLVPLTGNRAWATDM
eukprot:6192107-Pleurochrysis_carterae.AAC.4